MNEKIWIGKKKMFDEPCRAQLLGDTVYIVDDEEHLTGDGDRTRNIFDFSIDEAVSLANWFLETVDQSKGDE